MCENDIMNDAVLKKKMRYLSYFDFVANKKNTEIENFNQSLKINPVHQ